MAFVYLPVYHAPQERKYQTLFEVADHNLYCLVLHVVTLNILDLFDQTLCHHFDQNLCPHDCHASYLPLLAHVHRDRLVRDFLLHAFRDLSVHLLRGVDVPHLQLARLVSSLV